MLATLWRRTERRVKKVLQFRITRGFTVKIVLVDKPTSTLKLEPALWVEGRDSVLQFRTTRDIPSFIGSHCTLGDRTRCSHVGQQIPLYKYLNSGAIILQQVEVVGDRRGIVNGSKASQTERVLGSGEVLTTETIPASSIPPLLNCGSWIRASIIH